MLTALYKALCCLSSRHRRVELAVCSQWGDAVLVLIQILHLSGATSQWRRALASGSSAWHSYRTEMADQPLPRVALEWKDQVPQLPVCPYTSILASLESQLKPE